MALPVTIISAAGLGGHQPPIKSSAGNFYSIVRASDTAIDAYKATDPTSSFSVVDVGANNPVGFTVLNIISYRQYGDTIRVATYDSTTNFYEFHIFNMATDTWDIVDELIEDTSANAPTFPWISIDNRSDGDAIVVYAGLADQNMGGKKERVDSNERTGAATWTGAVALDAAGDIHYGNPNVVKGPLTDDIHIVWQTTSNTADPPTIWTDTEGRTLDPANSLSTTISNINNTGSLLGIQNGVSHEEVGVDTWVNFAAPSNAALAIFNYTTDASDDIVYDSSGVPGSSAVYEKGEVGIASIAEEGGDLHSLYSGGSTVASDQDIYYSISTNRGVTWSTASEEIDAITCNCISCNIYQRGTDTVLAYVYDDAGTIKYNEKVLSTGLSYTQLDHAEFTGLVNSHVGPFEIA